MPIQQTVYTIGTATGTAIVAPTVDAARAWVQNQQPAHSGDGYARDGYLYIVSSQFNINSSGTARFSLITGATGLQIDSYEIVSTGEIVLGQLVEGATITTTGAAIPGYNLNRNYSDAHNAVFRAATAMTGGTVVSEEIATATKQASGGGRVSTKIHTLEPSTEYGFRFINQGNKTTSVFFQMTFAETYDHMHDVWLGPENASVRLHGNESHEFILQPYEPLNASATGTAVKVAVLRQD